MDLQNILSLEKLIENLIAWFLVHGVRVVIILAAAWILIRLSKTFISRLLRKFIRESLKLSNIAVKIAEEREKTLVRVFISVLRVAILVVAMLTILPELGINIGPLLAGIGIGGLALGFGARSLVQDYISGLFALLEDHYRVGEDVGVAGIKGKVKDFDLRRTVIEDAEGNIHYIPNSQIKQAINFSRK